MKRRAEEELQINRRVGVEDGALSFISLALRGGGLSVTS
eukprot:SAG11_NODE_2276_length_3583_cov_2.156429_3_plen_39_part_00